MLGSTTMTGFNSSVAKDQYFNDMATVSEMNLTGFNNSKIMQDVNIFNN